MSRPDGGKSQRKLRNLLIMPKAQMELIINIVVLTLFFGLAACFVVYFQLDDIFDKFFQLGYLDENVSVMLTDKWNISVQWLAMLIVLYLVTVIIILLIQSHRMLGPSVALRRQLNAILEGRYSARVKLREGDYYQNIAELLNRVTEHLEKAKESQEVQESQDVSSEEVTA